MTITRIDFDDRRRIASTDYWTTEHARRGALYLCHNAGAFHLLVPGPAESMLSEMRTGKRALLSFGIDEGSRREAFDVVFDDGSENPFSAQTNNCQTRPTESRRDGTALLVYTAAGLQLELPARFRKVRSIPCAPWWNDA